MSIYPDWLIRRRNSGTNGKRKRKRAVRDIPAGSLPPDEPTDALPGTEAKILVMMRRVEQMQSCFHPNDQRADGTLYTGWLLSSGVLRATSLMFGHHELPERGSEGDEE